MTKWDKMFREIVNNSKVLLVFLGTVLMVLGANRGFRGWVTIPPPYWTAFLAAVGFIVCSVGVYLIWRREDDFNVLSLKRQCKLTIETPTAGSEVGQKIEMTGRFEKKPPDGAVVAIIEKTESGRFWFKEESVTFEKEKKWVACIYVGGKKERRVLYIAILGKAGQFLRNYFLRVARKFDESAGIEGLPPGIEMCDEVAVNFRGEESFHQASG